MAGWQHIMHAGTRGRLEDSRRADGGKKPLGGGHRGAGSRCQCHWRLMSPAVETQPLSLCLPCSTAALPMFDVCHLSPNPLCTVGGLHQPPAHCIPPPCLSQVLVNWDRKQSNLNLNSILSGSKYRQMCLHRLLDHAELLVKFPIILFTEYGWMYIWLVAR